MIEKDNALKQYIQYSNIPQRSFFLQQIETITERHSWSKCREQLTMEIPAITGTFKHQGKS